MCYRFSEDIDFSCRPGDDNVADAVSLLEAAAGLLTDDTGMVIDVRAAVQSPGQEQLEIPLHYSRGGARRQALPAVRVHLTFDEPVLSGAESRIVSPIYAGLESFQIMAYSLLEIAAEKLSAHSAMSGSRPRSLPLDFTCPRPTETRCHADQSQCRGSSEEGSDPLEKSYGAPRIGRL
ncbi:MAG TPA: nucleotidyl transferase AbiEii/AbiGii toxin family protein [Vicinamibacterales bacterium]